MTQQYSDQGLNKLHV